MTFEEQFPSLKEKELPVLFKTTEGIHLILFGTDEIKEFCLDKQKVKDAIQNQIWDKLDKEDLLKELGL